MKQLNFKSFSLYQLTKKNFKSHEIQRGLVWSPKQIGLLWDSIFKGIPIGTFMLLKEEKEKQILDGQQRLNAISLGLQDCNTPNQDKVIWVNIKEKGSLSFMVTTMSHPWGYNDNENYTRLTADEQRSAVRTFLGEKYEEGYEWSIYRSDNLNLNRTWPIKAKLAIPLQVLIQGFEVKDGDFVNNTKSLYKNHFKPAYDYYAKNDNEIETAIESLYKSIQNILKYKIGVSIVSLDSLDDIELLFNRINRGGTPISDDELAYSTIKAYFPFVKKNDIEAKVAKYIEPAKLARIVFRIVETMVEEKRDGFVNNLSLQTIRERGRDDNYKSLIKDFYKDITGLLELVDSIFNSSQTPSVLRSRIANQTPELYMLLMYIKKYNTKELDITDNFLCGLTFYLKWFCNSIPRCVNIIKHYFDDKKALKKGIAQSINESIITPLITPNGFEKMITIFADDRWSPGLSQWADLWGRVSQNREMLLFYQRLYINNCFCKYNPSISKMWSEHNTPWDFDHIIPQNWFVNYSGNNKYARFNRQWKDNIGNLAAIPFETNRSKNDNADWDYYRKQELLKKETIDEYNQIKPDTFNSDKDMSSSFAKLTFNRCYNIYEDCYKTLFEQLVLGYNDITPLAEERKRIFMKLHDKLENIQFYHVTFDNSKEQLIGDDTYWAWNMPWISCGIVLNKVHYVAIAIGIENNQLVYEIGVRKAPDILTADPKESLNVFDKYTIYNEGWWYIERDLSEEEFNVLEIHEEFNKLIDFVKTNS